MNVKSTQDGIVVYDALTINGNNFTVGVEAVYDGISSQTALSQFEEKSPISNDWQRNRLSTSSAQGYHRKNSEAHS